MQSAIPSRTALRVAMRRAAHQLYDAQPLVFDDPIAVSSDGKQIDLTAIAKSGKIDWTAPAGQWKVYVVVMAPSGMVVKRPAPGGAGLVLDPYSIKSLDKYLGKFDKAFASLKSPMPRSHFHDSFEYANATWTPDFLGEFQKRRGYDLRTQLPALFGTGPGETPARVKYDYRLTIAELHLDWIKHWTAWCHSHGGLSRDQAATLNRLIVRASYKQVFARSAECLKAVIEAV